MTDAVHSPPHYTVGGIETRDFIAAKRLNFNRGNVVKYVVRAGLKADELEDLEKAKSYLEHEIALVGGAADLRCVLLGKLSGDVRTAAALALFPLPRPVYSCRFPTDDVSRGLRELAGTVQLDLSDACHCGKRVCTGCSRG